MSRLFVAPHGGVPIRGKAVPAHIVEGSWPASESADALCGRRMKTRWTLLGVVTGEVGLDFGHHPVCWECRAIVQGESDGKLSG